MINKKQGLTRLTGRIVVPGDPAYNQARMEFNKRISKFPRVIVFCKRTQDVVNAVKWARENRVPIRVRSGRHSYEGFSVMNGAIVIDVSQMNRIQIYSKQKLAKIQTGNQLQRVYRTLWQKRVTIPAGTAPDVGIAGLTLGGGIGLLSRKYGLTLDNLKEVEMVVPHGRFGAKIIRCNAHEHADLFWACRGGGGGNFGVATSFTFKVHPISTVAIYSITWKWKDLGKVFDVWQKWALSVDNRLTSTIQMFSKQVGTVESTGQFLGSASELRRMIQPLLHAGTPLKVRVKTVPFIIATKFFAQIDIGLLPKFKVTGGYAYRAVPKEGIRTIQRFLANPPNKHANVECQSLGGAVARVSPTATAYVHRHAKVIFELSARWRLKQEQKRNIKWVESFRRAMTPFLIGDYVNFPDLEFKNWPRVYYRNNFNRLTKIKRKYDPLNVFHFQQSIPPAKN
ncbi:dehydrogenase [Brevibacillus choshinensis]|uniref:Dehydrogenase n=1 Tax=Brevibacillus choshinensis TaxID=54911 RepID=A0ABR5N474_BRECH|nr:FAD-binding oxidoreductase [Brevibacillus choshinensis]KQL45284.1 dehydrogenase [Brevibacillus choshinensis]